jgi:hypothetical protein
LFLFKQVLELLWNISHDKHLPNEIIDQALAAHLKILDFSCLLVSKAVFHQSFLFRSGNSKLRQGKTHRRRVYSNSGMDR